MVVLPLSLWLVCLFTVIVKGRFSTDGVETGYGLSNRESEF
jgi:hypothetical protein